LGSNTTVTITLQKPKNAAEVENRKKLLMGGSANENDSRKDRTCPFERRKGAS